MISAGLGLSLVCRDQESIYSYLCRPGELVNTTDQWKTNRFTSRKPKHEPSQRTCDETQGVACHELRLEVFCLDGFDERRNDIYERRRGGEGVSTFVGHDGSVVMTDSCTR